MHSSMGSEKGRVTCQQFDHLRCVPSVASVLVQERENEGEGSKDRVLSDSS